MGTFTTRDGTAIFFKDWGSGQPVVFSHGWPLDADAWDGQMLFLALRGYRVIAHDRRGHGRSEQTWDGNDMDSYADDLAELLDGLDLRDAILVGHSTGGGEVARYIGRHGTRRISKVVLAGALPPGVLRTEANPDGAPIELFDALREGIRLNRSQFLRDLALQFYGYNREGAEVSPGLIDGFWLQSMRGGIAGAYHCLATIAESDFTADLRKFDVPTLIAHGDDDQIVPLASSALRSSKLVKDATLTVYPGAPHGFPATRMDEFNRDLLEFIEAGVVRRAEERPTVH
jgi:non-heme chloroperoxidase